jgi:segregation and condensation protein A
MGNYLRTDQAYEVATDVYEGPLDLLLDLIQKYELDITKLALAQVTDQYLAFIRNTQNIQPENLSEFLIIAAKLIQIKSEALLPQSPLREVDEEDLGENLANQLRIYRMYKDSAAWLQKRIEMKYRNYLHISKTYPKTINVDMGDINLQDLVNAYVSLYATEDVAENLGTVISIPKVTIRKRIYAILAKLSEAKRIRFSEVIHSDPSKINVIVAFLAILELMKQNLISTYQDKIFEDIMIEATEEMIDPGLFEMSADM